MFINTPFSLSHSHIVSFSSQNVLADASIHLYPSVEEDVIIAWSSGAVSLDEHHNIGINHILIAYQLIGDLNRYIPLSLTYEVDGIVTSVVYCAFHSTETLCSL